MAGTGSAIGVDAPNRVECKTNSLERGKEERRVLWVPLLRPWKLARSL
jgi:hypothetical protein